MKTFIHTKKLWGALVIASAAVLALASVPVRADTCPPGSTNTAYCENASTAQSNIQQQQQTSQQTQQQVQQVSNPVVKADVTSALNSSNTYASQAQQLLQQAQGISDPKTATTVVKAASAYAQGANALAEAAQATTLAALLIQNGGTKAEIQHQLALAKAYSAKAAALIRQAQQILGVQTHARTARASITHATAQQQQQAAALVKQAQSYSNKSSNAATAAQQLVGQSVTPSGRVGDITKSVKSILSGYTSIASQTKGLEARINSATVRKAIDALLGHAKTQAASASGLQGDAVIKALAKVSFGKALTEVSEARVDAARARGLAASAHGIAFHAVQSHE